MTPEQKKEELSFAYVRAVAAACGYSVSDWSQDQRCIDVTLAAPGLLGGGTLADPQLNLQLKSTSDQSLVRGRSVAWRLSKAHYDQLRARASVPKLLVVLVLPPEETDWVCHTPEQLVLRRCAYWRSVAGEPDIDTESKVIHVPLSNVFSPESLQEIMTRISCEEWR